MALLRDGEEQVGTWINIEDMLTPLTTTDFLVLRYDGIRQLMNNVLYAFKARGKVALERQRLPEAYGVSSDMRRKTLLEYLQYQCIRVCKRVRRNVVSVRVVRRLNLEGPKQG